MKIGDLLVIGGAGILVLYMLGRDQDGNRVALPEGWGMRPTWLPNPVPDPRGTARADLTWEEYEALPAYQFPSWGQ